MANGAWKCQADIWIVSASLFNINMRIVDVILILADIIFFFFNNIAHFNISVSGMKLIFTYLRKLFHDILLGLPFACYNSFNF